MWAAAKLEVADVQLFDLLARQVLQSLSCPQAHGVPPLLCLLANSASSPPMYFSNTDRLK